MTLTPSDIHNKEFEVRMRGYDQDEVNEFLDQIIQDYEIVIREKKELQNDLEITNKKLLNYEEMQESLNKSIIVAQEAADRLRENTDREIEIIRSEAENHAKNVRKEADSYAEEKRRKADVYSKELHTEANNNADELLQEAVMKARKIEDETESLRKQSRVFRQRLQLLIESQLELLTKEDWDNLLVGKPIEYSDTKTIFEVEKELEEKEEESTENVEENNQTEDENSEDKVANKAEEAYNEESKESSEYIEGSMPAIELPEETDKK